MKKQSLWSFRLFKLLTLFGITIALIAFLTTPPEEAAFLPIPVAAIVINFVVTGWVVVIHKALHFPALRRYYRVFPKEKEIYEFLGIRHFKRMVNSPVYGTIWGPSLKRQGRGENRFERLEGDMRAAEFAHLLGFLVTLSFFIYTMIRGWVHMAIWLLVFNVLLNAYPVMLQRYNRLRLERILRHG